MAAKKSRSATFSGRADRTKNESDALVAKYVSYDDSAIRSPTSDEALLIGIAGQDEDEDEISSLVRRSLSQRISSSLNIKLPARLRRGRAHALGRRRTSTKIEDSFISVSSSKNTPHYVMTMESENIIE